MRGRTPKPHPIGIVLVAMGFDGNPSLRAIALCQVASLIISGSSLIIVEKAKALPGLKI